MVHPGQVFRARDEGEPHLPETGVGGEGLEELRNSEVVVLELHLEGWLGIHQVPTSRQREGQEFKHRL